MPSIRTLKRVAAIALVAATLTACFKVPFTGRKQFNILPDGLMRGLGALTYSTMLSEVKIARKGENNRTINKVGKRIAKVANEKSYDWEFSLIRNNNTLNAWCLPGGKIGVYTGLLPVLKNEAGLAFVMGHEVGHATAHHGAERLSQRLAVLGGLGALWLYLDDQTALTREQQQLVIAALGVGIEVGVSLPFSRAHEREADVIGLMYMAKAGYPPEESVRVWNRMEAAKDGISMPTFLSTHPNHKQRKENLQEWMPGAKKRYRRNALANDTLAVRWKATDFPPTKEPAQSSGENSGKGSGNSSGKGSDKGGDKGSTGGSVGAPPK